MKPHHAPKAASYARFLIHLASQEPEVDTLAPVTNFHLQKLLYYVQGWSLAWRGIPAFPDKIKAWVHGPVVPQVYHEFKDCGDDLIERVRGDSEALTAAERGFVIAIWERYRRFSASELYRDTHQAAGAWAMTRREAGVSEGEHSDAEISLQRIRAHFDALRARLEKTEVPAECTPANLEKARLDLAAGRGRDLSAYFSERGYAI